MKQDETYATLLHLLAEAERLMDGGEFMSMPFAKRKGLRHMRIHLDEVLHGYRQWQSGRLEPTNISSVHFPELHYE